VKITRIEKFAIIGLGLCTMLMVHGCAMWKDSGSGDADLGSGQPALNGSRVPRGMVLIPGGTISGTNPLAEGESHSGMYPATYTITVDDFLMDKTLVTKKLWDWVRDDPATAFRGYEMRVGHGQGANHPVQSVNWFDAVKWLNARSEMEGREPVYYLDAAYTQIFRSGSGGERDAYWEVHVKASADGFRLPTMDQWEYAARGGLQSNRFPWGDRIDHSKASYRAWGANCEYDDGPDGGEYHPKGPETGSTPYTTPVDFFPANDYGLHDMSGNLWEWNYDWHPSYVGSRRVLRGGSWAYRAYYCRVASRFNLSPRYAHSYIGFRAVLPPGQ